MQTPAGGDGIMARAEGWAESDFAFFGFGFRCDVEGLERCGDDGDGMVIVARTPDGSRSDMVWRQMMSVRVHDRRAVERQRFGVPTGGRSDSCDGQNWGRGRGAMAAISEDDGVDGVGGSPLALTSAEFDTVRAGIY